MRRWVAALTAAIPVLATCVLLLPRLGNAGAGEPPPAAPLLTPSGYLPLVVDSSTHTPTPTPTATNTPTPTGTPTPIPLCPGPAPVVSPLPDLQITHAGLHMQGWPNADGCMVSYAPLISRICVANRGAGDAGCFVVVAGDLGWRCDALASGEELCWEGEGTTGGLALADAHNDVVETDEGNNTVWIPVPTPPPECTPMATSQPVTP